MAWTKRFFFLPWQLHPRLAESVGTTTRISQHPLGYRTTPNGQWVFPTVGDPYSSPPYAAPPGWGSEPRFWYDYDIGRVMPSYAVTIEPDNVPLVSERITVSTAFNPGDTYPRYPDYAVTHGDIPTASVFTYPGGGYPPDVAQGPFYGTLTLRPAFFCAYEMVGVTSLVGDDFIMTDLTYPPPVPRAMWYKTRAESAYIHNWGGWRKSCNSGLAPMVCYVLRPSTGAIVGWLYSMWTMGGYGPYSYATTPVDTGTGALPGPNKNVISGPAGSDFPLRWNVVGIQDGDLIVWEWWHGSTWSPGVTTDYPGQGAGPWVISDSVEFGGGLAGQPLTFDGGNPFAGGSVPDWAPSQGARNELTVMGGIEPAPISSIRYTTISATFGPASDSTLLTVVN